MDTNAVRQPTVARVIAQPAEREPLRVALLPLDGFALMSFASACEPLRAANLLAGRELFRVSNVSQGGRTIVSSSGVSVPCAPFPDGSDAFDVAFVVAGGDPLRADIADVAGFLRGLARRGVTIGGISGGPVVLVRVGLMRGYRMTVHWEHAAVLAEVDADLVLERSLYIFDRDRITCAGGTAPTDMMHALIARRHGAAFARGVSDWFLHTEIRASAEPQRAGAAERYGTNHPGVLAAIAAMETSLGAPLTLDALAHAASLGRRQLGRLFQSHFGMGPMAFYREMRVRKARALLRGSALSTTQIALATGFHNFSHFATVFRQSTGQTPRDYRGAPRDGT